MKVILLEDVKALGKKGQIVNVSDGYARNMILPKKLGVEATSKNLNDLKLRKANEEKVAQENLDAAKAFAEELSTKEVILTLKVGEGGRTFGSVSSKEIAEAVKEQIRYELRGTVASSHVCDDIGFQRVVPALSLSFYECVENAKDYAWGGAKYNLGNGIDAIGVADLINSLIAVKKLVFDEKKVTMQRLLDALDANFVGYEDVKKMCDEAPKYGNDDDEVNELTGDMFCFIADYIESFHSKFGKMTPGILPVSGNTPFGLEVGALPSGRLAWKPLADGVSPNQGTDTEGMGAVLKSISHIPHGRFNQGTLLNVKMDTVFRDSPNSTKELMNYLRSLCSLGVFHTQFNVIDTETLKEAQKHPEDYNGLLVRVAGYTAYFTELGKKVQDDIISRTSHSNIC